MTEIVIVIGILTIILAIGIPQLTRWSSNSRLQASLQRMKGALLQARSQARNRNSTVVLPSGYNPNSATPITLGGAPVDELRVVSQGTVLLDEHIDEIPLQTASLTGPAMAQTDVAQAVQIVLTRAGSPLGGVPNGMVEAYDSSGNAVWTGSLTFSNGYQTWNLNVTANDVQLVQAP